jgi:predicted O-methyltransferase YrrM
MPADQQPRCPDCGGRIADHNAVNRVSEGHIAAALRDNGGGVVIGSELDSSKVAKANQHIAEAGLSQYVEIRAGDALQTLRDTGGPIDPLFLDGWKELYLDVLKLVSASLLPGAVALADDVNLFPDHVAAYLEYMRDPAHGFVSVMLPMDDGLEYSVRV